MYGKYLKPLLWIVGLQWQISKFYFSWVAVYSVLVGLRPIVNAFALSQLIALVAGTDIDRNKAILWLSLLLAVELLVGATGMINHYIRERLRRRLRLTILERLILKTYELSQEQFDNQAFNTKLERARQSAEELWNVIRDMSMGFSALITLVSALIVIFFNAPWWIGIIVIASLVPIIITRLRINTMEEEVRRQTTPDRRIADRSAWMLLDPKYMVEFRLLNAFKRAIQLWRGHYEAVNKKLDSTLRRVLKFDIIAEIIHPLINFGVNIYFLDLLINKTRGFDLGDFIFLRGSLEATLRSAYISTEVARRLHQTSINIHNFNEIYETEPAIDDGEVRVSLPLQIEFKNVSFKYPGSKELVLNDISFKIRTGEHLALVGENGAGKSTILKLMMRQYLPISGTIEVNGVDIRKLERESYYSLISHLSQEFFLPEHMTVRENLLIGTGGKVPEAKIWRATDLAQATSFIKELPGRLETRLSPSFEDGTDLSAGQRQRLCIARALLLETALTILDEPTSAVDAKAEYAIFSNIYRQKGAGAIIIVSHRFSTVRKADRIMVIKKGKIAECGSHEELMELDGIYREMFELQAEGYR